jgi:hypothetical protein
MDIDVTNVTLPGQAIGVYQAAMAAYGRQEITTLVVRDQPVALVVPTGMTLYTALRDIPGLESVHIGVFSTEELARAACQEERDGDDGEASEPLDWQEDTAKLPDLESYVVIMTTLNTRTGLG